MIRLGLRLTLQGGREAVVRLVITAAAIALGVTMVLITLAGINGVNAQNQRFAWLETGAGTAATRTPAGAHADPMWWLLTPDEFHGTLIGRVDVAPTGPTSPLPPGLAAVPGPGQYDASPAMSRLLRTSPRSQLADRYPGTQVGTIGAAGLPAPDSLVIVGGRTAHDLSHISGAHRVTAISTTPPSSCNGACYYVGIDSNGIDLVLSVAAAALLFPVLIFIGAATRLSAARREQRYSAMRLVGATPGQISVVSTVESTLAAVAGVALGFVLFVALRPALVHLPFTGTRFIESDLSLNLPDVLWVALGIPVAAAIAARLALRRVQVSPLGVTRRVTPPPPRVYRLIPLLLGIGDLVYFDVVGRPANSVEQIRAFLPGFLLIIAGLVIAGPWLTMVGSRLMARRANRPATLIAGRRLSDNPRAGFRAISGLIVALYVTSVAVALMTTLNAYSGGSGKTTLDQHTVVDQFTSFAADRPVFSVPQIPAHVLAALRSVPGVSGLTLLRSHTQRTVDPDGHITVNLGGGVASCTDLAATPALGRCQPHTMVAEASPFFGGRRPTTASTRWPTSDLGPGALSGLPVQMVAIATRSDSAVERTRTILERAYPMSYFPETIAEQIADNSSNRLNAQYQQLVDVVILTSLPIAGCSLAVSMAAGLSDRKRPFSLLRLTGAPIGMLRRVVAFESAVPLVVIALFSIGVGFGSSALFLRSQLGETLHGPGIAYYLIVLAGIVASLCAVASTLPLLNRITGPDAARND